MSEFQDQFEPTKSIHDYHRAVRWLESLIGLPIYDHRDFPAEKGQPFVLGLRRFADFLEALDISIKNIGDMEIIHVAGTSGKGSVSAYLASILHEEDRKTYDPRGVGAFFSPHVTSLTERIWVNGRLIEPADVVRIVGGLKPHLHQAYLEGRYGIPSFFEITLALALLQFRAAKCRRIVLEVGLGGTHDATNVFQDVALSIITKIGLDHTDVLGNTVDQIAAEKAGIVKPGGLVLSGVQVPSAQQVIQKVCREQKARLISLNDTPLGAASALREWDGNGSLFDFQPDPVTGLRSVRSLENRMAGSHQVQNACLAAAAAQLLGVSEEAIRSGIRNTRLPARAEVIAGEPTVVLDGAHNPDKARALQNVLDLQSDGRRLFILGVLGDKDAEALCDALLPDSAGVFVTRPTNPPRPACALPRLAEIAGHYAPVRGVFLDPDDAVEAALREARSDDWVCVTGSLFLAGEVRGRWHPVPDILGEGTSFPDRGEHSVRSSASPVSASGEPAQPSPPQA